MKHKVWRWFAAVMAMLAMPTAHAQHRQAAERNVAKNLSPPRLQPPNHSQAEMRPRPESPEPAHVVHMSPEERQQLRRDIGDAGRELYRGETPGSRR